MRRLAFLLTLVLVASGCGRLSDRQLDRTAADARAAMLRGELDEAQAIADRGAARTASRHDAQAWRFRLLRAEILILRRDFDAAAPFLSEPVPAGAPFDPIRARQKYLDARRHVGQGHFDAALDVLRAGRPLASSDPALLLDMDALDGQIQLRLGKWKDAEAALDDALARARGRSDEYREAIVLNDLGMSRFVRSRYDEALPFFERVVSLDRLKELTIYAASLSNAGACYSRLGQLDRAMQIEQRAFEIHQRRGPRVYFEQALGQLGNLHVLRGEPKESVSYYDQALRVASDAKLTADAELWAGNLATAYADLRQWDQAERYNDEAKRLWAATHAGAPVYHTLNSAAIAAGRGRFDRARSLYEAALASPGAPPSVVWDAHFGLAEALTAAGDPVRAGHEYEAALNVIETTRAGLLKTDYKVSYLTRLIAFYQAYVQVLIDRGDTARALDVADSSRGRVLAERGRTIVPAPATAAAFRRLAAASHAVFLSYWLTPARSYLWVVAADGVHQIALPPAAEIDRLVREHQATIANVMADPLSGANPAGARLYRILVAPAARWIAQDARVVIVPDGSLHGINFETLRVDDPRPHFWIEDAEVEIAPSLAGLTAAPHAAGAKPLLLIGNPPPRPPEFPALRYAAAEMSAVAGHFDPDRVTVYAGAKASPAAYRAAHVDGYKYVHFTAHAAASADSPLDSAVVLSGSDESYKLYARDVADLPLTADLVTVSACRSAGERAYSGEGLVGFAWAFLRAGARRVIAGLWDVDDRSSAELMDSLYANLAAGERPSEALRRAKLALLAKGGSDAAPYRWAPLQLFTVVP